MRACWLLGSSGGQRHTVCWGLWGHLGSEACNRAPAVESIVVQSSPTGGMPETLAAYRKRVAELTKGKANASGLRDDRHRSDLADAGGAGYRRTCSADHVHRLTNELWPTPGEVGHSH
jgi:hypothetical protein